MPGDPQRWTGEFGVLRASVRWGSTRDKLDPINQARGALLVAGAHACFPLLVQACVTAFADTIRPAPAEQRAPNLSAQVLYRKVVVKTSPVGSDEASQAGPSPAQRAVEAIVPTRFFTVPELALLVRTRAHICDSPSVGGARLLA